MGFRILGGSIWDHFFKLSVAAFYTISLIALSSCDRKEQTPKWDKPQKVAHASEVASEPTRERSRLAAASPKTEKPLEATPDGQTASLRFICYNVENWLTMDRYHDQKSLKNSPKPESEKQAVIRILSRHTPDVIGLSEIGQPSDLAEIQQRLKTAGLDFPHSQYASGSDMTRRLGFLSRFPISSTSNSAELEYRLAGQTHTMNRGILDATVAANDKNYRFLGVHLKSKRESEQGDQEAIRLNEARLLRRHVNSILEEDADARVIVYGDFNDTRGMPTIKAVTGNYHDPTYLTAIPAKDSHGETWTHFWEPNDVYSRLDFVMVARALRSEVDFPAARIIDDAEWIQASDHRPILVIFKSVR
ncbi:MAG: endonuclease/exonuclease/phosphatase family protein [Akkermansiaceae bacterium]|nr:endonuclease/exonuclease/phosphatase family protein [Akkermansiaceae bacterium]